MEKLVIRHKQKLARTLSHWASGIIRENSKDLRICIFSNDCWGGEFYRCINKPYNTPFVGLMLMAPCYINFLKKPRYYLDKPLLFTSKTLYPDLKEIHKGSPYPIGLIDDIEIHFLHYQSETEALIKWNSRKSRIDWDHIYVKFSMDKDYANEKLLKVFDELPYKKKISFSKGEYTSVNNLRLKNYTQNGAKLFPQCFKYGDILHWFKYGEIKYNRFPGSLKGYFISRFLQIT